MERAVSADGYGICLFSADALQGFLKQKRFKVWGYWKGKLYKK